MSQIQLRVEDIPIAFKVHVAPAIRLGAEVLHYLPFVEHPIDTVLPLKGTRHESPAILVLPFVARIRMRQLG